MRPSDGHTIKEIACELPSYCLVGRSIAVIGGSVAGLAAADRRAERAEVALLERQSYEEKRVNCGEGINDVTLIPLEKTRANGFLNDVEGFELRIFSDRTHAPGGTDRLRDPRVRPGYVTDRDV